mgnify:CR=1 FL=1
MITAALFLSKFVGAYPWVHLDIASTDWSERERAYLPKGPTGKILKRELRSLA